jgi:stress-induced morphogen
MIATKLVKFLSFVKKPLYSFGESNMILKREKEVKLAQKIKEQLNATYISVNDVTIGSNSCTKFINLGGQMYKITVESPQFVGKTKVQQHQMVSGCIQ